MEPPADPAEPSDPADPSDPSDRAQARAKPQGKWALVRSLNHALKTYAVLPVRPARGGGGCTLGIPPRASVSPPGRNGMSGNGWQRPGCVQTDPLPTPTPAPHAFPDSQSELGPSRPSLRRELLHITNGNVGSR